MASRVRGLWPLIGFLIGFRGSLSFGGTPAPIRLWCLAFQIHQSPCDEEEHNGVEHDAHRGGAPCGSRDPRAKQGTRLAVRVGTGHDEEDESRQERNDKLVLLFATAATTSTVFK